MISIPFHIMPLKVDDGCHRQRFSDKLQNIQAENGRSSRNNPLLGGITYLIRKPRAVQMKQSPATETRDATMKTKTSKQNIVAEGIDDLFFSIKNIFCKEYKKECN